MDKLIRETLEGKTVVILGFGREGRSTYRLIRKALPGLKLTIADADEKVKADPVAAGDPDIRWKLGKDYLKGLDTFDRIIRTPGISLRDLPVEILPGKITSQTDLFLRHYSRQVIGVTGTKGKSTTTTLIWHILKWAGRDAVLLGNIGRPAFTCLDEIGPETHIVFELSSHQLEYLAVAPHVSLLLNLFPEHLDTYPSFKDYRLAKWNIVLKQEKEDIFIFNADDPLIRELMNEMRLIRDFRPFSVETELCDGSFVKDGFVHYAGDCETEPVYDLSKKRKIKGDHNLRNIMAAITACKTLGISNEIIQEGIASFTGLEHRLEYAGEFHGIRFYNDSISTIPEATIAAVKTLEDVDTLILGGFDRGIDYSGLAEFLVHSPVRNLILVGEAGRRINEEMKNRNEMKEAKGKKLFMVKRFDEFIDIAIKETKPGHICLLSPAAASYDEFPNFEIRGKRFNELIASNSTQ